MSTDGINLYIDRSIDIDFFKDGFSAFNMIEKEFIRKKETVIIRVDNYLDFVRLPPSFMVR
jgi:hypothetical protein